MIPFRRLLRAADAAATELLRRDLPKPFDEAAAEAFLAAADQDSPETLRAFGVSPGTASERSQDVSPVPGHSICPVHKQWCAGADCWWVRAETSYAATCAHCARPILIDPDENPFHVDTGFFVCKDGKHYATER